MGPIGTVKRSFLPVGYSRGSVKMQLNNIKRVGSDKESLTGLLTVKNGSNQVTESATAKWSSSDGGFKVKSSGVSTIIDGEDSISVVFDMSDLSLKKTMKLNLDNNVDLSSSTSSTTSSDRTVTALSNYNDLTTVMSDVEDIKTELAFPQEDYILDAQMSDIPDDGVLEKLLIFRKYALDLQDMTITKKANTLGAIMVVGKHKSDYGNFTDFKNVTGLESIEPPTTAVAHKMNNVKLVGLGNNTDDKDINALTLVNLSDASTFTKIRVIDAQDDGIEIFGGNVNMTDVMVDSAADDYFDTDHGHSGTITNLKLFQTSKRLGKSLIECGNSGGTTTTTFVNVTFNDSTDVSSYQNNGSDNIFNIKSGSEVTINGDVLTGPQDAFPGALNITTVASSPLIELHKKGKEFYYNLADFEEKASDYTGIWQEFQYMGLLDNGSDGYTGHDAVGNTVKNAHGNVIHGPFVVPIYSDYDCTTEMGYINFIETARVEDPNSTFIGQQVLSKAKIHVKLNDENTLSYGITCNDVLSGYYELEKDVIVKITGNTKTGPFGKNTKVFSDAVDYKTLRIRKVTSTVRKCLLSIEEDPLSFHSSLSLVSSPMTSVAQNTATLHRKFYYNSGDFQAVSTDESKTVYQDYQYASVDPAYSGHGADDKVGDNVEYARGNITHAVWSVKICSDSAGENNIGEISWVITALIDDPDSAIGKQTNGLLTKEEIWLKLDGSVEDTICIGYTMNRTDSGYYTEDKDVLVKIIKNGHVGPFEPHDNFANFSNFNSMRIRNIGDGIRECVVSTDENPPTFEEGEAAVAVSLDQSAADEEDLEFYYDSADFGTGEVYQDYQYISVDAADDGYPTGHGSAPEGGDAVGESVQYARGNVLYAAWSVPIYDDSAKTNSLGGISWVIQSHVPDTSLPFTGQDLTTSEQIFVRLDNQSSMAIGQCSNVLAGGYYEEDKDVLVDIVDNVNQGPLEANANHTTAAPGFQKLRVRNIGDGIRKCVISKSSIHPSFDS